MRLPVKFACSWRGSDMAWQKLFSCLHFQLFCGRLKIYEHNLASVWKNVIIFMYWKLFRIIISKFCLKKTLAWVAFPHTYKLGKRNLIGWTDLDWYLHLRNLEKLSEPSIVPHALARGTQYLKLANNNLWGRKHWWKYCASILEHF